MTPGAPASSVSSFLPAGAQAINSCTLFAEINYLSFFTFCVLSFFATRHSRLFAKFLPHFPRSVREIHSLYRHCHYCHAYVCVLFTHIVQRTLIHSVVTDSLVTECMDVHVLVCVSECVLAVATVKSAAQAEHRSLFPFVRCKKANQRTQLSVASFQLHCTVLVQSRRRFMSRLFPPSLSLCFFFTLSLPRLLS